MVFNSMNFLLFFPIVVLLYFVFPEKKRYIWLLVASYFFYMCWNAKYIVLLLFSTVITYVCGLVINRFERQKKILIVSLLGCILAELLMLFAFKYFEFALYNINLVLSRFGCQLIQVPYDIILPVGISFYTFQTIGYVIDVYRGKIKAERNFLKYALFVSFFPQLVAGPIERSGNLLAQIQKPIHFNFEKARDGMFTIAYGLFLKVVVADNIACVIDSVFLDYLNRNGMELLIATILFGFQIYCDFQGYSLIAIGSARVLGISLCENFQAPYMASNVRDFWRRWHISLTSWFTDYVYIPLGGNRKGYVRKQINTFIVFLLSGLWHGASWHYVIWGGLNGLYIILQDISHKFREKLSHVLKIDRGSVAWKILSRLVTFALVDWAWLFFRATGTTMALQITKTIIQDFHLGYLFSNGIYDMFGTTKTFCIILVSLSIVVFVDFCKYRNVSVKAIILQQQIVYRWCCYIGIILIILFLGAYGDGYEQTQFIYFQF